MRLSLAVPILSLLISLIAVADDLTQKKEEPQEVRSLVAFPAEFLKKGLKSEQLNKIVENCPVFERNELAEEYLKSRKVLETCTEARSIEMSLQKIQGMYDVYLYKKQQEHDFREQKKDNPSLKRRVDYQEDDEIKNISRMANSVMEDLEKLNCANKPEDYIAAALPMVAMIAEPYGMIAGEAAKILITLYKLLKPKKPSLAEKFEFCAAAKKMESARSMACENASYSEPYRRKGTKDTYRSLGEGMKEAEESQRHFMERGRQTKIFKILTAFRNLQTQIHELDTNKDVAAFTKASKAIDQINIIDTGLDCVNNSDIKVMYACNLLLGMKAQLNKLTPKVINPDFVDKQHYVIGALKQEIQGFEIFDDPRKDIAKVPPWSAVNYAETLKAYEQPTSAIPGESASQVTDGIAAFNISIDSLTPLERKAGQVLKDSNDRQRVKDAVREALDLLPEKLKVDKKTCQFARCFWKEGKMDYEFEKNGNDPELSTGWHFASKQDFKSIQNANGRDGSIEIALANQKRASLEKLTDDCQKYSEETPPCNIVCNPFQKLFGPPSNPDKSENPSKEKTAQ